MDMLMADFVEELGPGQIVDRQAVAAVPAGFIKVIICNNVTDLCLFVSGIKESMKEPELGLKMTIKSYLGTSSEVLNGVSFSLGRLESKFDRNLTLIRFDRNQFVKENHIHDEDDDEILQICIYARRSNTKCLIGFVHVSMKYVIDNKQAIGKEAWYKVFPTSSFLAGLPVKMGHRYHINTSSSHSPISTASSDVLNWVTSLGSPPPRQADDRPSSSSGNSDHGSPKKNTLRNVAKAVTRFMKRSNSTQNCESARVDDDDLVQDTLFYVKSLNVCSAKTIKSHGDWKSLAEKQTTRVNVKPMKKANSLDSDRSSKFATLKRLALKTKLEENCKNVTKIQRCEEIICVPSPTECRPYWGGNGEENNYMNPNNKLHYHGYGTSLTFHKNLHFFGKSNSVESSGGEASSVDTEESGNSSTCKSMSSKVRVAATVCTWVKKVQKKAKFRSLARYSTPMLEDMEDDDSGDNVYEVLKYSKTLSKPGRSESHKPSIASKINEETPQTVSGLSTEEKLVTQLSRTPVSATNCSNNSEALTARNVGSATEPLNCQQKRKKFAQKRSLAVTCDATLNCLLSPPSD